MRVTTRPGGTAATPATASAPRRVITDIGPVEVEVPRDRDASFEPQIVAKRQRRLPGVERPGVLAVAKGLTTGEISAHLAEIYGIEVSKETITTITDRVMEGLAEWQSRPLDRVYPVIFIDAINVKIRDGQVANRPIYVAMAVTVDGERDILGPVGRGARRGEGAKYWLRVLTEIKNRGVADVCIVVCDGLKGLPDAIGQAWPQAIIQTCIVHLLRNCFRYASQTGLGGVARTSSRSTPPRPRPPPWSLRRVRRRLGGQVPGDRAAVGERVGRVRAVPGLRPARSAPMICTTNAIESPERPVPQGGQGPRPLPDRAGRPQAPLPGRHQPGPDRAGTQALVQPVEGRPERLRHHLRRPALGPQEVTKGRSSYTVKLTDPPALPRAQLGPQVSLQNGSIRQRLDWPYVKVGVMSEWQEAALRPWHCCTYVLYRPNG